MFSEGSEKNLAKSLFKFFDSPKTESFVSIAIEVGNLVYFDFNCIYFSSTGVNTLKGDSAIF